MNTKTKNILKSLKIITCHINKIERSLTSLPHPHPPNTKKHKKTTTTHKFPIDDYDYDSYIQKIMKQGGL
jgi:hypothetical protein